MTRLAILASGTGRTIASLADVIERGELDASIELVVTDRPEAPALERARERGIATLAIPWRGCDGPADFSRRAFRAIEERGCELVVLAGFLRLLVLPRDWEGRVINVHPSLLPAFGGKGYWGDRVHRAVLERGVRFTGCTVHLVDAEYDHGRILVQRCVEVRPGDTVATLAARVFEEERVALPEGIRLWLGEHAGSRGFPEAGPDPPSPRS